VQLPLLRTLGARQPRTHSLVKRPLNGYVVTLGSYLGPSRPLLQDSLANEKLALGLFARHNRNDSPLRALCVVLVDERLSWRGFPDEICEVVAVQIRASYEFDAVLSWLGHG
jgi:hypothetical protein